MVEVHFKTSLLTISLFFKKNYYLKIYEIQWQLAIRANAVIGLLTLKSDSARSNYI